MLKPMLAATLEAKDLQSLTYPLYVQEKLDGIRCLILQDGRVVTRSLKPLPNRHIQATLSPLANPDYVLDGELMLQDERASFQQIVSAVMTEDGIPDFVFHAFDLVIDRPYSVRQAVLTKLFSDEPRNVHVVVVPAHIANTPDEVIELQSAFLAAGNEGAMLRHRDGVYKFGRSTLRSQGLLKFKNFSDSDAEIIGYVQRFHNGNEATTNELGRTARSSHKENMVPVPQLGAVIVKDVHSGVVFNIGTGFVDRQRIEFWVDPGALIGKFVKYKYFAIGVKEETGVPRFPVFIGFRDPRDMS